MLKRSKKFCAVSPEFSPLSPHYQSGQDVDSAQASQQNYFGRIEDVLQEADNGFHVLWGTVFCSCPAARPTTAVNQVQSERKIIRRSKFYGWFWLVSFNVQHTHIGTHCIIIMDVLNMCKTFVYYCKLLHTYKCTYIYIHTLYTFLYTILLLI